MSQTIDERIVQMQFDNAQFEKNIKQSMTSLDKLDNSIDNLGGNSGLNGLNVTINSVGQSFSAMGAIGFEVFRKITDSVLQLGANLVNKLMAPLNQMKSGGWTRALNIENAKFQFEGLGVDVKQAMEDATYAVNETAYSLDAAAMAASNLSASGIKAGADMKQALRAISGVAAQTNSSYEDIAHTFTRVAGNGRLMGEDLQSLSSRGMNAAATLGKYFGKTEQEIREMVSKGKISFEMFSKAMFDTFGEHAVKANETYTGSLANMNAALSKIGADFQQHKIQNMIRIFNSLRLLINGIRKELTPVSEAYGKVFESLTKLGSRFIDNIVKPELIKSLHFALEGLGYILNNVVNIARIAREVFRQLFPDAFSTRISDIAEKFRDFAKNLTITKDRAQKIAAIIGGIYSAFGIFKTILTQVLKALFPSTQAFENLGDILLTVAAKLAMLITQFYKWLDGSQIIYKAVTYVKLAIYVLVVAIIALEQKIKELFQTLRTNEKVIKVFESIKSAGTKAFNYISSGITKLIGHFKDFKKETKETFSAAESAGKSTSGVNGFLIGLEVVFNKIKELGKHITPTKVILGVIAAMFTAFAISMMIAASKMSSGVKQVGNSFEFFSGLIKKFMEKSAKAKEAFEAKEKFRHFIEVAGLLVIFAYNLRKLAELPLVQMIAAATTMIVALVVFAKVIKEINKLPNINDKKVKQVLLPLAVVIASVGWALSKATKNENSSWLRIAAAGGGIIGAIAVCSNIIKALSMLLNNGKMSYKKMIAIFEVMSTLGSVIYAIGWALDKASSHNWTQILAATLGLGGVLSALSGVIAILSVIPFDEGTRQHVYNLLILSAVLLPIGIALSKLAKFGWTGMLSSIVGIAGVLTELVIVSAILQKIGKEQEGYESISAAASMLILSFSLIAIAQALNKLAVDFDWKTIGMKLALMGGVLTIMGGVLAALGSLGTMYYGLGAVAILAASVSMYIFSKALIETGKGIEIFSRAFVVMSRDCDFTQVAKGLALFLGAAIGLSLVGPFLLIAALGCKAIGGALLYAAESVQVFANAFSTMTSEVDFKKISDGLIMLNDALNQVSGKAVIVAGALAIVLAITAKGIKIFSEALVSLSKVDVKKITENLTEFINGLSAANTALFAGIAGALNLLAPALMQIVVPIKLLAAPSIALGAAFLLLSLGFLAIAGALRLISPALKELQSTDWITLSSGLITFADALWALGTHSILLGIFGESLLKAGIAIALFCVEAWALTYIDLESAALKMAVLSKAFEALVGSSLFLPYTAICIGLVTAALYAFGAVLDGMSNTIPIQIAQIVASVQLLSTLTQQLGSLVAISFTLPAAAIAIGVMAAAIYVLGKAVETVGRTMPAYVAGIIASVKQLSQVGKYAVSGFVNGIASGLTSVAKSAVAMGKTFISSLTSFLGIASPSKATRSIGEFTGSGFLLGLADKMEEAEKAGKTGAEAVVSAISSTAGEFFDVGSLLGGSFNSGFQTTIGSWFNRYGSAGNKTNMSERGFSSSGYVKESSIYDTLAMNFSKMTNDIFPDFSKSLDELTGGMVDAAGGAGGLADGLGDVGKGAKGAKDELDNLRSTIEGQINLFEEFNKESDLTADQLIENMKSQISGAAEWTTWIHQLGERGASAGLIKKLAEMGQSSGYKYAKAFMEMSSEQLATANVLFASSLTIPDNAVFAITDSYKMAGEWASYGFANGITPDAAKDNVTLMGLRTLDALKESLKEQSPSKATEEMGKNLCAGLNKGIGDKVQESTMKWRISTLANTIFTTLLKEMPVTKFIDIGKNVVAGVQKGIEDEAANSSLMSSVSKLCSKVVKKGYSGFQEKSPSKIFEEIGRYIDLGLAKGIAENTESPVNSIDKLVSDTTYGMQSAVDQIKAAFNQDLNVNPTIRPVVDLTDVNSGINTINGMLPSSINARALSSRYVPEDISVQNGNGDVVSAIDSLKEDVAYLGDAITHINLVLDTGTMVGAMTPAIDQELYTRQVYAGRGI